MKNKRKTRAPRAILVLEVLSLGLTVVLTGVFLFQTLSLLEADLELLASDLLTAFEQPLTRSVIISYSGVIASWVVTVLLEFCRRPREYLKQIENETVEDNAQALMRLMVVVPVFVLVLHWVLCFLQSFLLLLASFCLSFWVVACGGFLPGFVFYSFVLLPLVRYLDRKQREC